MTEPTAGYLELCFHVHEGENLFLRIPTVWDPVTNEWRGFIKTPKTQHLIHAKGKDCAELEHNFIKIMHEIFSSDDDTALAYEVFGMFAPKAQVNEAQS